MESSTPDPVVTTPELLPTSTVPVEVEPTAPVISPLPAVEAPAAPATEAPAVPSLSLDDTPAAELPSADLDAVFSEPAAVTTDAEPIGFDLGDSGYAETLARESYGQPAAAAPTAPAPVAPYPQPMAQGVPQPAPYPQPAPSAPANSYAQPGYAPQPDPYAQANPYAQSPYAQQNPYAEPSPYVPVPYTPAPTGTLTPEEERTWASAAHWSALVASVIGLGFLGPLLVYLIQGPKSAWVKAQAAESLNFEITFIIAMIASALAVFLIVGIVPLVVFPILWLVFRIIATVATGQGRDYRYPVAIRMVK